MTNVVVSVAKLLMHFVIIVKLQEMIVLQVCCFLKYGVNQKYDDNHPIFSVWGKCNHAFHMHCILKWLETQQTCCMCRRPWEFRSEEATEASDENDKEENSNVQEESQDNLDNSEDAPN